METNRFGEQVFSRNEGHYVIKRLSGDSRATLRHYEMVAVMQNFSPLAPLHKHGVPISGPKFYHAVITDWNLYLFSRKGADAGKVVLDMPLLCVRDLAKEDLDGDDLLLVPDTPHEPLKSSRIALYPQVDASKIPRKQATQKKKGGKEEAGEEVEEGADISRPKGLVGQPPWYKKLLPGGSAPKQKQPGASLGAEKGADRSDQEAGNKAGSRSLDAAGLPAQEHQKKQQHHQLQHQQKGLDLQHLRVTQQQRHLQQQRLNAEEQAQQLAYQNEFIKQQQLLLHGHTGTLPPHQHPHQSSSRHASPATCRQQPSHAGPVAESVEHPPAPGLPFSPSQQYQLQQQQQQLLRPRSPILHTPITPYHSVPPTLRVSTRWPPESDSAWPASASPMPSTSSPDHASGSNRPSPTKASLSAHSSPQLPPPPPHSYSPTLPSPLHARLGLRDASVSGARPSAKYRAHAPSQPLSLDVITPIGSGSMPSTPRSPLPTPKPLEPLDLKSPVLPPVPQPHPDDQWAPAPSRQAGAVIDKTEDGGSYALVMLTLEYKSNFFIQLRQAWVQAHLRLSISQSRLPGMPVWYTPPPSMDDLLPFILGVNREQKQTGHHHQQQQDQKQQGQEQQDQKQRPEQQQEQEQLWWRLLPNGMAAAAGDVVAAGAPCEAEDAGGKPWAVPFLSYPLEDVRNAPVASPGEQLLLAVQLLKQDIQASCTAPTQPRRLRNTSTSSSSRSLCFHFPHCL
mmetsp:Transcript_8013/g.19685  ORF Transcript_8013/g.19685 Transcript_8013/m.19685 type:complete len:734 (-) Transcript_8013:123-2324(-)